MDLERITSDAQFHRDQFFKDEWFDLVLMEHQGASGTDLKTQLAEEIAGFLQARKIDPQTGAAKSNPQDSMYLFGAAYHAARKGFLTTHDIPEPSLDSIQVLGTLFNTAVPLDNGRAARFLESMCDIYTKNSQSQRLVVESIAKILPALAQNYQSEWEAKVSGKPAKVAAEAETRLKEDYSVAINKFAQYTKANSAAGKNIDIADFYKFAGIKANGHANGKAPERDLTPEYINRVLKTSGNDVQAAIRRLEEEVGPVIAVDWDGTPHRETCKIPVLIQGVDGIRRHQLNYHRNAATSHLRDLFTTMCEYSAGKPGIDPAHAATSRKARPNIDAYFR